MKKFGILGLSLLSASVLWGSNFIILDGERYAKITTNGKKYKNIITIKGEKYYKITKKRKKRKKIRRAKEYIEISGIKYKRIHGKKSFYNKGDIFFNGVAYQPISKNKQIQQTDKKVVHKVINTQITNKPINTNQTIQIGKDRYILTNKNGNIVAIKIEDQKPINKIVREPKYFYKKVLFKKIPAYHGYQNELSIFTGGTSKNKVFLKSNLFGFAWDRYLSENFSFGLSIEYAKKEFTDEEIKRGRSSSLGCDNNKCQNNNKNTNDSANGGGNTNGNVNNGNTNGNGNNDNTNGNGNTNGNKNVITPPSTPSEPIIRKGTLRLNTDKIDSDGIKMSLYGRYFLNDIYLLDEQNSIYPYIKFGGGYELVEDNGKRDNSDFFLSLGAGMSYSATDMVSFYLEYIYEQKISNSSSNSKFVGGISIKINKADRNRKVIHVISIDEGGY